MQPIYYSNLADKLTHTSLPNDLLRYTKEDITSNIFLLHDGEDL
jgi:hypothetical protein